MNSNLTLLEQAVKDLSRYLEQSGFACERENVNAFDAWLGTIPGQGDRNIRRLFINSINLAHVVPLHSVWSGAFSSAKESLLPSNAPPVFYAATTGKTPFRFNIDVGDVGHQIVLGPTGAGKTTFLQFETAQFFRYENAEVFKFDKDYSHQAEAIALGGHHYDIGNSDALAFCPLNDLSTNTKKSRAERFIEDLVELQQIKITPDIRSAIHRAIESLSDKTHEKSRNITVFASEVQHKDVREALRFYTIDGQFKLLDATHDSLKKGRLHTFEMNWLLNQKPEIYLPVLRYIFDHIESRLEEGQGRNPTLIIIEEAWLFMDHPVFAKKLKDWLKTLRKKNARVIFATQSLADLYDPTTGNLTTTTAAIMESCLTKVFLPNPTMDNEIKQLYKKMSLTDRQIEIIAHVGIPKRHYYVITSQGNRLIDLGFSDMKPMTLSFIGLSKEKSNALMSYKNKHGDEWVYFWLQQQGFMEWAEYWKTHYYNSVKEIAA